MAVFWHSRALHPRPELLAGRTILLELVVQRFQTDPKNLRRPRLVVAGMLQRTDNQHLLRVLHRSPDPEADAVRIVRRWRRDVDRLRPTPQDRRPLLHIDCALAGA